MLNAKQAKEIADLLSDENVQFWGVIEDALQGKMSPKQMGEKIIDLATALWLQYPAIETEKPEVDGEDDSHATNPGAC